MRTGRRSGYWVVEWSDGCDANLADLVPFCPSVVLGQHVAIASCDSGHYRPTIEEIADGWLTMGGVGVSPKVKTVSSLPMPHFDEWYVYDRNFNLGYHRAFVNRLEFGPLNENDPETETFWAQIELLQPNHVVGAGAPVLFLVTRDEMIYRSAIESVSRY
jgi:hypothetical protein